MDKTKLINNDSITHSMNNKHNNFFVRLKKCLAKTRQHIGYGFIKIFHKNNIDDNLFDKIEERLIISDVGVFTTRKLIQKLIDNVNFKHLNNADLLYNKLREEMTYILTKVNHPLLITTQKPFIMLIVGVNGVGKTTTIGKLAHQYKQNGKKVMLVAGDTFRVAALEQLQIWGNYNNIPVITQRIGADAASVIFDAIHAAQARGIDVLLIDTAGRLHNKLYLMNELKKIIRVIKKIDSSAPHETMLIVDATTGQNAISQTDLFNSAIGISGITLTKLDSSSKGGVIFAISDLFNIPIRYIGIGETIDDLRSFETIDFIDAIFFQED